MERTIARRFIRTLDWVEKSIPRFRIGQPSLASDGSGDGNTAPRSATGRSMQAHKMARMTQEQQSPASGASLGVPYAPHSNGGRPMTEPTDVDEDLAQPSRRRFLREGGALVGGAVMAGGLAGSGALAAGDNADNLPPEVPEWMKTPGDPMGSQPYGTPSPFEKGVVKNIPTDLPQYLSASGRTPLQDLDGIITPNGLFYERHHGGVPAIDPGAASTDAAWPGR
jgi:hypothetical protein